MNILRTQSVLHCQGRASLLILMLPHGNESFPLNTPVTKTSQNHGGGVSASSEPPFLCSSPERGWEPAGGHSQEAGTIRPTGFVRVFCLMLCLFHLIA